eukprot:118040_1
MTMNDTEKSWIALVSTTILLCILLVITLQQICTTMISDKTRLIRLMSILYLTIAEFGLNELWWLAYLYPDQKLFFGSDLSTVAIIYEAIIIVWGFHMYRKMEIWIIQKVHFAINIPMPAWVECYFMLRQIFVYLSAMIFYILKVFYHWNSSLFVFYMIMGVMAHTETWLLLWSLCKAWNAFSYLHVSAIWNWATISYNLYFIDAICHSIMVISVVMGLVIWTYKPNTCCTIYEDTICAVWGCGEFCAYECICCCETDMEWDDDIWFHR